MKIAVSGSAGIGKSTLARALADALGIPYIPEHYENLFALPDALNSPPQILAREFNRVLDFKISEEDRLGSFVVDRTPADLLNLAMRTRLVYLPEGAKALYERCRTHTAAYDLIIIPPWGVVPLRGSDDGDGQALRVLNPWLQLINHAAISGLVRLFAGDEKVLFLPDNPANIDDWLSVVLKKVEPCNSKHPKKSI
jgi:hypothetical protein